MGGMEENLCLGLRGRGFICVIVGGDWGDGVATKGLSKRGAGSRG